MDVKVIIPLRRPASVCWTQLIMLVIVLLLEEVYHDSKFLSGCWRSLLGDTTPVIYTYVWVSDEHLFDSMLCLTISKDLYTTDYNAHKCLPEPLGYRVRCLRSPLPLPAMHVFSLSYS